ncbi:MAG: serine/threonine-protein kinase [Gemmatimonadetes bacterium]|nr:serine/threonine-protein kinase [Gemmatimonadota bacterium]
MSDVDQQLSEALAARYEFQRELGQGGMATVYLAKDLKHGREVAVKVLRPDLAASIGSDRFLREIEIAARLQHPHIVVLIVSGEAAEFLYYVMPYVEGESLRGLMLRQGLLGIQEAMVITKPVADALTYAHRMGVVHRDIKPENILLSQGHPVVTDFGIAKPSARRGSRISRARGFPSGRRAT